MLRMLAAGLAGLALVANAAAASLSGAGGSFPAPLYAKWAEVYRAETGIGLNYQAIGSGGGIKQIKARTVDFGASDKPLKPAELAAAGLYQFPTVMGGVVPVMNIPGLRPGMLRLTGALLADIYLGKIRRWNAPQIAAVNPRLRMPNLPITVVHRSDGSGTSFLFTSYLAKKSPEWATQVGASDAVQWPTGLGGKGNDGVAAFVKQTVGSIGYVEYAYARHNGSVYAALQNHDGNFVLPGAPSFIAAAAGADWLHSPGNRVMVIDVPGAAAWPIMGATFILIRRHPDNPAQSAAVLRFFGWAYRRGDPMAVNLDFVPLPPSIKALLEKQWAHVITAGGKPVHVAR